MQRGWVVSTVYKAAIAGVVEARVSKGVSQRELARRLSKPPSFINKIEKLERRLDIIEFIVIAEALGLESGELLKTIRSHLPHTLEI